MNLKEFRNLIRESKSPDWYNSTEIKLVYPHLKLDLKFTGFSAMYKFLEEQIKLWEGLGTSLPPELLDSKKHFIQLRSQLLTFVESNKLQEEGNLNSLKRNLQNYFWKNYQTIFPADSPEVAFLLRVFKEQPSFHSGAFRYLTEQAPNNISQFSEFSGYLLGYEFANKDSAISKKRSDEKASLTKLRNDFFNSLPEMEQQLNDHLVANDTKVAEYNQALDSFKEEKESTYSDWFQQSQQEFTDFKKKTGTTIEELEKTYQEKLKLEAPARYWRKKSEKFYKEGSQARTLFLIIIGVAAVVLVVLLFTSPDWIFNSVFNGNATAILRWSFLFITFISLVAYALKAVSKVMFSAYHLARDAEERHTLTFFYLALLKESDLKEEERNMVIQALFSRVDTGLLKDDSGPSMPNDLSKFLNRT